MFDNKTQKMLNKKLKERGIGYVHLNTKETSLTEEELDEMLDFIQNIACKRADFKNNN